MKVAERVLINFGEVKPNVVEPDLRFPGLLERQIYQILLRCPVPFDELKQVIKEAVWLLETKYSPAKEPSHET